MLIPSELTPEWLSASIVDTESHDTTKSQEQALAGQELPIERDITAWPTDAPRPPFVVGGVYRWQDGDRLRVAHVITEQTAIVNGSFWHVSEMPFDAELIRQFAPDDETVAEVRRFIREIIFDQRWS